MNDQQLHELIRQLLQDTYTNLDTDHVLQSETELKVLSQNDDRFSDAICNIVLNDNDKSIIKAAIIQIKNFDPENIVNLFVLFNEHLSPFFHKMLYNLLDILYEHYIDILYSSCISFSEQINIDDFSDIGIKYKKTQMMIILSLISNDNHECNQSDEYTQLKTIFNNSLLQNTQFIAQIIQSIMESNELDLSEQQILFFNYFIQAFKKIFFGNQEDKEYYIINFFEFIHMFLCFSLQSNIDYIFPELETNIVDCLFYIYSVFFDVKDESFLNSLRFNEVIYFFDLFVQQNSPNKMPLSFFIVLQSFFRCKFVYYKYKELVEQIIVKFIWPLYSYDFFSNITDDVEFISSYYPNITTNNLQSYAMLIIFLSFDDEYLTMLLYSFASELLPEFIKNEQEEEIFSMINMMTNCSNARYQFQIDSLSSFCNYISENLLDTGNPLINISVMHFISNLPKNFQLIPDEFIHYMFLGLSGQLLSSDEDVNYKNIILYFSITAYSNFLDMDSCPFPFIDQNLLHEILIITINFNEYFKTEEISTAICSFIEKLTEIDDEMIEQLTDVIFSLFIQEPENIDVSPNYIYSLQSLLKIGEIPVKVNAARIIFDFFYNFLKSSENPDSDKKVFTNTLNSISDEFFDCLHIVVNFLTKNDILQDDDLNEFFSKIKELYLIIFSLSDLDIEWECPDNIIMCFINLRDRIDVSELLAFYVEMIELFKEHDFIPTNFNSLRAFLMNFISHPEVQAFQQEYQQEIDQINAYHDEFIGEDEEEAIDDG